jgi:ABC-type branched-subunit amino acid transport system substrate-binding protein
VPLAARLPRREPALACLLLVCLLAAPLAGCSDRKGALRIGVMLPLSGPDAVGYREPLEWARDAVNGAGGVDGRQIELVFRDTARDPVAGVAKSLAEDRSIVAVIGPDNSAGAHEAVATFVHAHKVVVTPSATSADLFRAYARSKPQYFWRPLESDIAQVGVMLSAARAEGATSAALVTGDGAYGETFFDWFGFLALEEDIGVTATVRYDEGSQTCDGAVAQALAGGPDVLLAVPDGAEQAECMARAWRKIGGRSRLIFSDAAQDPSLVQALGPDAEGLEGTAPGADPSGGFAAAYEARFGHPPPPYAASTYDSLLLVAYGLATSGGRGGSRLAEAIDEVVSGDGQATGWDGAGVRRAIREIDTGRHPQVTGAVGAWAFDRDAGIELVASDYERWRITGGTFTVIESVSTAGTPTAQRGESQFDRPPTLGRGANTVGGAHEPAPRAGGWALLVAASVGWENYRHQADVLAQYQWLRSRGVAPDHIVVVMADDLADNPRNPERGTVRNAVGGPNLHPGVRADYSPTELSAEALMSVLEGKTSPETPKVIASGPDDDLYVYMAGHGDSDGLYLGLGNPVPSASDVFSVLTPDALNSTIATMAEEHRYRRLFVAVEACHAGVFGTGLTAPGAILMAAAGPVEDSVSANYDPKLRTWLADQFSYELWTAESERPAAPLDELYRRVYLAVDGSHVGAYGPAFGDPATVSVQELVSG